MQQEELNYTVGSTNCQSVACYDSNEIGKRPAVLLVHAFEGRTDIYLEQIETLAEWGYVGVAVDMYGEAKTAHDFDGCIALMSELTENRALLRERILAAYEQVKQLDAVDPDQIAIMGFCFGGLTALDLARANTPIKAAVSIHGVFAAPDLDCHINSKVLILHGYEDPQCPPSELPTIAAELDGYGADWQAHFYSNTKHAFTDPKAADIGPPEVGREYNELSTKRVWNCCNQFFKEVFDQ